MIARVSFDDSKLVMAACKQANASTIYLLMKIQDENVVYRCFAHAHD